jgi:hypothetical protein
MKYKIVEVPWINYEVHDEDGKLAYDDRGDNLFDTKEEAEDLINILKLDEAIRERYQ